MVTIEHFMAKNVPKEVRGIMWSVFYMSGMIGRMICYKLAGILFDIGRAWPFIMIGIFHFAFFIFVLIMIFCGRFERKITKEMRSTLIQSIKNKATFRVSNTERKTKTSQ